MPVVFHFHILKAGNPMSFKSRSPLRAFAAGIVCLTTLFVSVHGKAATWQDVRSVVATRSLATDGHIYVAAASNGIWTSHDMKSWTRASLPSDSGILYYEVLWDGSRFIAVGEGVITSTDGSNWSIAYPSDGVHTWQGIATDGSTYIVVGSTPFGSGVNDVLRSTNGTHWGLVAIPASVRTASGIVDGDLALNGIASDGAQFVADGLLQGSSSGADFLMTSPDGVTWTSQSLPTPFAFYNQADVNGAAWGGGTFVSGGLLGVYTSPDGVTWTDHQLTNLSDPTAPSWLFNKVAFLNGGFIATGFDAQSSGTQKTAVFKSSDGATWTAKDLEARGTSVFGVSGVAYSGGKYALTGYQGAYTSSDGVTWSKVFAGPQTNLSSCVVYGGGRYVVLGERGSLVSTSASTWPNALAATEPIGVAYGEGCAAFGAGVFVAAQGVNTTGIQWSADGTSWNTVTTTNFMSAVAWDGQKFLGIGAGGMETSKDGKNWTSVSTTGVPAGSVVFVGEGFGGGGLTFANGLYIAWGTLNGTAMILTSTDGKAWQQASIGSISPGGVIGAVAYGAGKYLALGNASDGSSLLFQSTDGLTWSKVNTTIAKANWYALVWGDNQFMASGGDSKTGHGVMLESNADGSAWTATTLDTTPLYDLVWDGHGYLAVSGYDLMQFMPGDSSGGGSGGSGSAGGSSGGGGAFDIGLIALLAGFSVARRRR